MANTTGSNKRKADLLRKVEKEINEICSGSFKLSNILQCILHITEANVSDEFLIDYFNAKYYLHDMRILAKYIFSLESSPTLASRLQHQRFEAKNWWDVKFTKIMEYLQDLDDDYKQNDPNHAMYEQSIR